ncbi:MAG: HAMP domain-containing protein [Acidobacteria bacterium]|nr:HAMP domain-containing protein [Acidobacteriota bacterium]
MPDPNNGVDTEPVGSPRPALAWHHRLSLRLSVAIVATSLLGITVFTTLTVRLYREQLVEEAIRGAALFSDAIKSSTHDEMLKGTKAGAYRVMSLIGKQEKIEKVRMFNKEGTVTYSTNPAEKGTAVNKKAESCYACHAAGQPIVRLAIPSRARIYRAQDGHRVLGMVTPIYNEPGCSEADCHAHPASMRVLGVVDVSISLAEADASVRNLTANILGISFLAVLLVGTCVRMATRSFVLKPVAAMMEATARMGSGDLKARAVVHSKDELGLLANSVNDMAASLYAIRKEKLKILEGLERQVEERTAELRKAQAQLVQTEKLASLGKLAASIAHEINNPLAGILTFSKTLIRTLDEGPLSEKVQATCSKHIKLIQRETERCTAIVRNLLDFARQRPLDLKDLDVHGPLEEALSLCTNKISLQGIELRKNLGPPFSVNADFGQLRQAFLNVLLNACDVMPKGGVLEISSRPTKSGIEIVIADSGPGIPPEILSKIFDPFFTTKEKGTGLGLSVVYGVMEKHGGTMRAESEPGKGTRMIFALPRSTEKPAGA